MGNIAYMQGSINQNRQLPERGRRKKYLCLNHGRNELSAKL